MKAGRRIVPVVLVHALLGAVALGAVAVWGPGTDPKNTIHVTIPDPDRRAPGAELLTLVRPPGTVVLDATRNKNGKSPLELLPKGEAKTVMGAGVVAVKAMVTRDQPVSRGIYVMAVRDGADPHGALRAIDDLYAGGGWKEIPGSAPGVIVREQLARPDQPIAGIRAHYLRGPYLIRIEAYGTDTGLVEREYGALAQRQLAEWPPL